jgi:hypothetical protein
MPEVIFTTREELVEKVKDHLGSLHCSTWGRSASNFNEADRLANAEWLVSIISAALGTAADDSLTEYRTRLRHALIEVTWDEGGDDLDAVSIVADAESAMMEALIEKGVIDPSISGRLVNSDVGWPRPPEVDEADG